MRPTRRSVPRFPLALLILAIATASASSDDAIKGRGETATLESFRFDPDDLPIILPLRMGDKTYPFMIDIGCSCSVFDASMRAHLGSPIGQGIAETPAGDVKTETFLSPAAAIGKLKFSSHRPVTCLDLTVVRESLGREIRGMLGVDFFRDKIVVFDFDEGRLNVLKPDSVRDRNRTWGEYIPFVYDLNGIPCILVAVGKDARAPFKLDTGCRGTGTIDATLFASLSAAGELRISEPTESITLGGIHRSRVGWLAILGIGPYRHENLRLGEARYSTLGLEYLRRYRVTLDFPGESLFLAKGKRFTKQDRGPMVGWCLLYKSSRVVVNSIDEKSPAFAAGVRVNDILLEVAGKSAAPLSQFKLESLMTSAEGKPIAVTLERQGKRIEVTVTPKQYH
jgi:hypothetical protein